MPWCGEQSAREGAVGSPHSAKHCASQRPSLQVYAPGACETGHPHDPAWERRLEVGRTVARCASLHMSKPAHAFLRAWERTPAHPGGELQPCQGMSWLMRAAVVAADPGGSASRKAQGDKGL
jgi:hypothetical protein